MLSLEYLLEEAKGNGLPLLKRRGIVREYLQIIILNSIYKGKFGRKFFFMGGTAMRYFYNMPRFSEDLDFNTSDLTDTEFKATLDHIVEELSREGFPTEADYTKRGNLLVAEIVFKDAIEKYKILDRRGPRFMIKVEINKPSWTLSTESKVFSMYGYNLTAILMSQGNLLSEKLLALFNRKKGRDIYDTLFMLRKGFPVNYKVLKENKIELPVQKKLLDYLDFFEDKELKRLAEQVKPFLFKEDDIELVIKAPLYAARFLENYENTH